MISLVENKKSKGLYLLSEEQIDAILELRLQKYCFTQEIIKELDPKLTEVEVNGIIEEIDEDGSGTVDFDGKHTHTFRRVNKLIETEKSN